MSTSECSTGLKWTGDDHGSALMHPGGDCIQCHSGHDEGAGPGEGPGHGGGEEHGEGPMFVVAGTIQATAHEADDCAGLEGAQVVITDANQKAYTLKTNASGNFFIKSDDAKDFAFPYTARITHGGTQWAMNTPQSTGACASCHTVTGANGAPGRISPP
ncbi:hypothetical protein [Corallococcus sp. Z5C101001]|uniref:hypothetical protein n=1 Tax=Corallococcus sp. Z5C101001 TaxID=2596829 RepID=UPI00163DC6A1|nr:hypothetical protein [Corallococcus sp. Z5C101001]